jgi:hypothetical protein
MTSYVDSLKKVTFITVAICGLDGIVIEQISV